MDIAKFLRLPIFKNVCERVFLDCFNDSLTHRPKGLMSVLYDSVRLQDPVRGLVFCFKMAISCPDMRSNTFDESIKFLDWLF